MEEMTPKKKIILIGVTVVLVIAAIAGSFIVRPGQTQKIPSQKKSSPSAVNTTSESPKAVFDLPGASFTQYKEVKSQTVPSLPAYTLRASELTNLKDVASAAKVVFDNAKIAALEKEGFFLATIKTPVSNPDTPIYLKDDGRVDDMIDLYSEFAGESTRMKRKPENALFITSDFLLHIYHVLIDRTFQKIETDKLQPALKELTSALYESSLAGYLGETNAQLKNSLKRTTAFYLVPLSILEAASTAKKPYFDSAGSENQEKFLQEDASSDASENIRNNLAKYKEKTPAEIFALAGEELDLVLKAEGMAASPLYGSLKSDSLDDYTQYKPRGHYTKNSTLRTYFRAMMWYGRHGFDVKSEELTRDAVLMTWQLSSTTVGSQKAFALWQDIYLPTVFFVGRSDDLTYSDYAGLVSQIYGPNATLTDLTETSKLTQLRQAAQKLEGPKILSEIRLFAPNEAPTKEDLLKSTKGFRFMGQRFIPDSFMLATLTQGNEKPDPQTNQSLPSTPTALMIMSILGSKTADSLLPDWIAKNAPQSDKVIEKVINSLKTEFQKYDEKTWTQNIYWAWLYNLLPLFNDFGQGYPQFMRGLAWTKKSLVSALGSWTELRHDTLLYAKQSYAELGGGPPEGEIPPVPKGYVEPNLSFLTRLIALNKMTSEGLDNRKLLVPGQKEKFEEFGKALEFFLSLSEKELANEIISDDEYEDLRTIVKFRFPRIVWSLDGDIMTEKDARMGIIADVHTDALKNQILYEAVGTPAIIYVAVKDKGGARLTRGAVYSYYEFTNPIAGRLSDEDWQAMIYEGKNTDKIPQSPSWTKELMK